MRAIENYADDAKLWIYQSNKPFDELCQIVIKQEISDFVADWQAHGVRLNAGFQIIDNQFIALFVDEENQQATGCSIDKSVVLIKNLETKLNLNLTDKGLVAYVFDNEIKTIDFKDVKKAVQSGEINLETKIFNLAIVKVGQLKTEFKIAAKNSWLARYF